MEGKKINPIEGIDIEFKQINVEDFDSQFYTTEKHIISPNDDGYLADELKSILNEDFQNKNTVIINAGVGQGKSQTIIDKAIDYSKSGEYIVVIAVPYNNLIEQYEEDCLKRGISPNQLFNIQKIEKYGFLKEEDKSIQNIFSVSDTDLINKDKISNYKIHIMTINALLGNSGDEVLFQSKKRLSYFGKLSTYCEKSGKRLVIIFDEIHDAIHNFREEYIYKVWRFQNLIHKNFIISATFNEASKEVIKYLSEFTDRKIKIIESKRIKISQRQSKLNFIFNDFQKIIKNANFKNLLENLLRSKKDFDVIVYSKKQIEQLFSDDSVLKPHKKELNLCYRDIFDFKYETDKTYDKEMRNIGTNFTTGVNIEKENHTLIVILPKRLPLQYVNNKGVFSAGVNTIIQTLARQRKVGEIYIVMPTPHMLDLQSLPHEGYLKQEIDMFFQEFGNHSNYVDYSNTNQQGKLLNYAYNRLVKLNETAKEKIENTNRFGMNSLDYPTKERFILEKGEKFLTSQFFNGDLSTYTFFSAITNQFLNCTINEIFSHDNLYLDSEEEIESTILEIYQELATQTIFGNSDDELDEMFHYYLSEFAMFKKLRTYIETKNFFINGIKADVSQLKKMKKLLFALCITHGNEKIINEYTGIQLTKELSRFYFQSCVKFSEIEIFKKDNDFYTKLDDCSDYQIPTQLAHQILHYKKWKEFIDLIESEISEENLLPYECSKSFRKKFREEKIDKKIEHLIELDSILNAETISFRDAYYKADKKNKVENFYNVLVRCFFDKDEKSKQITNDKKVRIRFHQKIKRIELSDFTTNLMYDRLPEAKL